MVLAVVGAFVLSRLLFYLTAIFAMQFIGAVSTPAAPSPLIGVSWQWDGFWYSTIIEGGYNWQPGAHSNVAFFPLFPMIVRAIADVFTGTSFYTVGVIVNHIIFLLALTAVWFYAEGKAGREVATRTVFLVSIFPTALFFSAAYSEPVFLLTCALSLGALHRRDYLTAGAAGLFASLARPAGLLLVIPYAIELWRNRGGMSGLGSWARKALPALLIPIGIGLYALYLGREFGEPLAFSKAQAAWGRELTFPLLSLWRAAAAIFEPQPHELVFYMNILNVVTSTAFLVIGALMWRSDPSGGAFVVVATLIYLAYPVGPGSAAWDPWQGNSIQSMSRYVVTLFPAFVPIARWGASNIRWPTLIAAFVALQVMLTALFQRGHYVF